MLKFLRKYNKFLLVAFGVFLMVTFLLPQAIGRMGGNPRKITAATTHEGKVTIGDLEHAAKELRSFEGYAPALLAMIFGREQPDAAHWYLLSKEARDAGYVGETDDGMDWAPELAVEVARLQVVSQYGQYAQQIIQNEQYFSSIVQPIVERLATAAPSAASYGGLTLDEFHRALAKARGVNRLLGAYQFAARMSDRRAVGTIKNGSDVAFVDYLYLPADRIIKSVPDPDEATLNAFFEKFKDTPKGEGDFGIGYRQPARVKLEWMRIDRDGVRKAISVDPVEVYKRYESQKDKYAGEPFERVQTVVESEIREEMLTRVFDEIQQAMKPQALGRVRRLPEDGIYRKLPPDWASQRPKFADIAPALVEAVKQAAGVEIPLPEVFVREAAWLSGEDLAALPGIGEAQVGSARGQPISFPQVALGVREIAGDLPVPLQVGIPVLDLAGRPIEDLGRNRYYFTVLDALKESPAQSLDEVRERALVDYKKHNAYEQAVARADEFRKIAAERGLAALVEQFDPQAAADIIGPLAETPLDLRTQVMVNKRGAQPSAPEIDSEEFRTAVIDAAAGFDPLKPIGPELADAATVAVPVPSSLGLVVARITALQPVTTETYRIAAENAARSALLEEFQKHAQQRIEDNPFSSVNLKKRHGYVPKQDRSEEEDLPEDDQPAPAAPAEGETPAG